MTFTPASASSLFVFEAINLCVVVAAVAGDFVACRRARESATKPTLIMICLLAAWIGIVSAIVASGAAIARPMPLVPMIMVGSLVFAIAFALSPIGRRLSTLPLWMLIAFQSFRLPLELVLHEWVKSGTIPETMTWSGQNFDILSGIVALIAAPLTAGDRSAAHSLRLGVAWFANLIGIGLLLNVIRVAAMSSPLPFAWHVKPPLQVLLYLPYAWIAPVCVGGAMAGHVVLTRKLLQRRAFGVP